MVSEYGPPETVRPAAARSGISSNIDEWEIQLFLGLLAENVSDLEGHPLACSRPTPSRTVLSVSLIMESRFLGR